MTGKIIIRAYNHDDLNAMTKIWNEVVKDGVAFPQTDEMNLSEAESFFTSQTFCGVAEETDTREVLGLYILHPNNVGRCAHIANASYAVAGAARGKHIGEHLVRHSISMLRPNGFRLKNGEYADICHYYIEA